ncbi:MAG: quinone oxidoreductase [Betaproteobacteria bacterium RIFCSPLOWO2_02_FULL_62_17]|nr:MAG: quinone oxidoreductase [Betaproteobacteria bacterium RIFCSPLOWO2_02_FULL_62_17]
MAQIKAFRIRESDKKTTSGFEDIDPAELDNGEVLIRVAYSSINYKDALAATGAGKIIRRFPCVGGIDLAGSVIESSDARFKSGDPVIATSYDMGVAHDGGYAEVARIPADWIVPLPQGMSAFESMALGTAGYTAALGIQRMELNGLSPANGPVIVTGATGGVGSLAIDLLAGRGYKVTALTGKPSEGAYLRALGAAEILDRKTLDLGKIRALEKPQWAGAVDNLGGAFLSWLASSMQVSGTIASIGLAAGMDFKTTVAPFILRGVCLLGIDSGYTPMPLRREVWRRLATDLRPRHLAEMTRTIAFDDLPGAFGAFLDGQVRGRTVVRIGG